MKNDELSGLTAAMTSTAWADFRHETHIATFCDRALRDV